jgi:hypothetical protein
LIDSFFESDVLNELKYKITQIVVGQMWQWDNYFDEQGIYYCLAALEKLATDEAISNLKLLQLLYGAISKYVYLFRCYQCFGKMGKIKDLLDLLSVETQISNLFIDAFIKFETSEVISAIDNIWNYP